MKYEKISKIICGINLNYNLNKLISITKKINRNTFKFFFNKKFKDKPIAKT